MATSELNLQFDEQGLIPAVIQDAESGEVLMVAYMNEQSLAKTKETGYTWFYSRSRQALWQKGEQSGHVQRVQDIFVDCDNDTLLIQVIQEGAGACHKGYRSCFHTRLDDKESTQEQQFNPERIYRDDILTQLYDVISQRKQNPVEGSYTNYLFTEGINKILKKVGEESAEVIIAAKDPDDEPLIYESADLLYHLLVLLAERDIEPEQVLNELRRRRSGK